MEITLTSDGIGLSILVVLFLAFIYSFIKPKLKDSGDNKDVLALEPDHSEKLDEVLPVVDKAVVAPDEVLSAVAEDVSDAEVEAAVEGVIVEHTIESVSGSLNTFFLGIEMAQMPDVIEGKRIRWLREQMGACQPEGQKRSVPFSTASSRMKAYYLFLGEQAALVLVVPASPEAS